MLRTVFPPIPPDLHVTVSVRPGRYPELLYLQMVNMIGEKEYNDATWQNEKYLGFTSAKASEKNLERIGLYTFGIATCVGIGMLFQGESENAVGLVHLSSPIVYGQSEDGGNGDMSNALVTILSTLYEKGTEIGASKRVVLVFAGPFRIQEIFMMTARIDGVLDYALQDCTKDRVCAVDLGLSGATQMAGNVSLQLGPYDC